MNTKKLNEGIAASKSGNRLYARQIFLELTKDEPDNETAWLWLAGSVDDIEEKKNCLRKAISINPSNQIARKALGQFEIPTQPTLEEMIFYSKTDQSSVIRPANKTTEPINPQIENNKAPVSSAQEIAHPKNENKSFSNGKRAYRKWIISGSIFVILCILIGTDTALIRPIAMSKRVHFSNTVSPTSNGGLAFENNWWEFIGDGASGGLGNLVHVIGTIKNTDSKVYKNVQIHAVAIDGEGAIIGRSTAALQSSGLSLNESSPYNFYFNVTDRPNSVNLSITYGLLQAQAPVIQIPTKTPPPTSIPLPIGSSIQVNGLSSALEIKVADILIVDSVKGIIPSEDETAKGRFALIFLDVTNKGSGEEVLSSLGFLTNESGQRFSSNPDATLNATIHYKVDPQPIIDSGKSAKVVLAFDIPKEGNKYSFRPGMEIGIANASGLLVDIPTSDQILTPTPSLLQSARPAGSIFTFKVYSDSWQVSVNKVMVADSITNSITGSIEKANGRFAILFMNVKNTGNSPSYFYTSPIKIKDASGNMYEDNLMATIYAQDNYGTTGCTYVNPGVTLSCIAVYDISLNSEYYVLTPGELNETQFQNVLLEIP